jgi:hypothetical protein
MTAMERRCEWCGAIYDDADSLTFCPHAPIMAAEDLARKDAGLALLGRRVRFAHQPDGPAHEIVAVGWNGMVALRDLTGEFAPHLFIPVEDAR